MERSTLLFKNEINPVLRRSQPRLVAFTPPPSLCCPCHSPRFYPHTCHGTMMNCPYMPCPSDTLSCMYCPLYFATHVHNVHCNTASHMNMKVEGLLVHPKTAHIIPQKMDKPFTHLHLTLIPAAI
jgi:hypothetical protein